MMLSGFLLSFGTSVATLGYFLHSLAFSGCSAMWEFITWVLEMFSFAAMWESLNMGAV